MKNLLTIVGERIRFFRKNRGLTQEQLGEKVELPQSYIGGIERGEKNISLETLERIVDALKIEPSDVLTSGKKRNTKDEILIDKILLNLQGRSPIEIEIIHNLIADVLKAFDNRNNTK
ncbi:helix-turn-helix domain-containing protein [Paenibacillus rigui]|uniref:Transcriptional regulator n=1 Tax=Paenibacillus rigui TaxID=554312 RepID=A0A229UJS3_9BACL|nr:helix-turn-helix transcriptional regulator [Paenibacillus rigui]OXM83697.1 transcriptional regulator [Paenibacillus rigui]